MGSEAERKGHKLSLFLSLFYTSLCFTQYDFKENTNIPIEEDPGVALCYHTRGEIKEAMGDLHGTIDDFKEAIKNTEYTKNSKVSDALKRVKEVLKQQE